MQRGWPTIKEYMDAQNELGSCMPEFRESLSRSTKFGASVGVPFGLYVAYRHHRSNMRAFAGKSFAVWFATTTCFSFIGLITATYNCLRVKM